MGKIADAFVEISADQSKLDRQISQIGKSVNDNLQATRAATSRALLDVSRGVQDFAAAGIMGVVNNVEGIARNVATAMGKSASSAAGLAGGLTMLAVGVQVMSPLLSQLRVETQKFFGLWKSEADTLRTSVTGLMEGGSGLKAMSAELQKQSEFLQGRSDKVGGMKIDFISRAMGFKGVDERALENNQRRAIEATALMSRAFETAANASFQLAAAQRGASAQFDMTTGQKDETRINSQLFQAAVDRFGGGDNLRTKIESEARQQLGMNRTQSRELYGRFSMGDIPATRQIEKLLDLTTEKARILADDWERATGSAEELRRIENAKAADEKRRADEFQAAQIARMTRDTQKAAIDFVELPEKRDRLEERLADFETDRAERLKRSFNFASLADARDRMFMAATDSKKDELTASKMRTEIQEVVKAIRDLNVKWGMQ